MTDQPPPDAALPAVISRAVSAAGYWLPGPGCDAAAQAVAADLDTARRRAVALVERIDAGRAWARRNLTAEQQAGLFAALAGRGAEPRTVLDTPAGQSALDRIRASITTREQKADEAHDAGNYRTANEHNAIAAGLRIAEGHVQLGHDAEVAMLRQRLALADAGLGGDRISLRKADVDLATAQRSRDRWRRDYAELAARHKRVLAEHEAERELSVDLRARLKATSDSCSDATTLLAQIGEPHTTELSNEFGATECRTCRDPWPCDTATILAALEPPQQPTA